MSARLGLSLALFRTVLSRGWPVVARKPSSGLLDELHRAGLDWRAAIRRALGDPALAFQYGASLVWGQYYKLKFRLLGRRVIVGTFFRVSGPLDIRGPGTVIFGDHCRVRSSRLHPTTPYTHAPEAVIKFGNRVMLTGTRLGCLSRIEVEDDVGISEARIMDADFHSVAPTTDGPRYGTNGVSKPVFIGRNAWIGTGAMVLKGVKVGANSIVGAGAVVAYHVPPDTIVFGNPARVIWRQRRSAPGQSLEQSCRDSGGVGPGEPDQRKPAGPGRPRTGVEFDRGEPATSAKSPGDQY